MDSKKTTHIYACQTGTSNSVKQHRLRKLIASLSKKEGFGKEFISLYIPPNASIEQVVSTLKNQPNSDNMNHDNVPNRFRFTFKNLIQHLKSKKEISENGLAVFAGTYDSNGQKELSSVEELVPPEPVTAYLYEVDHHFHLEPLRKMLRNPRVVGILAIDSKEASFGLLNGERLELIKDITSGIPGKTRKGGQSQRRYERERDMEVTYFFHRVAEHAAKAFLEDHKVMAVIVGGPGTTKNDFLKGGYLHYELENAVLSTVDTQSASKEGVKEILEKSSDTIKNMCAPEEKMVADRLFSELSKQNGLATYGIDSVTNALRNGEVEVAITIDNVNLVEIASICKKCGLQKTEIVNIKEKAQKILEMESHPCERCKSCECEVEEKDIVDVLEDMASQTDARVEVISTVSEEKTRIAALGGVAALLRYRPDNKG